MNDEPNKQPEPEATPIPEFDPEAVARFVDGLDEPGPLPANNSFALFPDLQGYFSDAEGTFLARVSRDAAVFEVGSWKGRSTVFAALGKPKRVVALDWFKGDAYAGPGWFWPEFEANVERYGVADLVVPIRGRFQPLLEHVNLGSFDVLHYDADHDEQPTEFAMSAFASRARPDAVLLCHDANYPQVWAVCEEIANDTGRSLHVVDRLAVLFPARRNSPRRFLDLIGGGE